jgi:hypothetical protein
LSQARSYLAATSIYIDNRYAFFGGDGYNRLNPSNVVEILDLLSGMWNTTTLSQARYFLTSSTLLENLAFFGGGERINNNSMNENDSKIQQQKKRETIVID